MANKTLVVYYSESGNTERVAKVIAENKQTDLLALTYDTIFIGYPIWWGIAAWPVDEFVKTNDFTGKTVIPFATSSTSELADSGELLSEMAKTGKWLSGERFSDGRQAGTIKKWLAQFN